MILNGPPCSSGEELLKAQADLAQSSSRSDETGKTTRSDWKGNRFFGGFDVGKNMRQPCCFFFFVTDDCEDILKASSTNARLFHSIGWMSTVHGPEE